MESICRHGNAGSTSISVSVGSLLWSVSHFNKTSISVGAFSSIAAAACSQSSMHALSATLSTAVSLHHACSFVTQESQTSKQSTTKLRTKGKEAADLGHTYSLAQNKGANLPASPWVKLCLAAGNALRPLRSSVKFCVADYRKVGHHSEHRHELQDLLPETCENNVQCVHA